MPSDQGLHPGGRFGPYEIVAPLGAGGMGEVWRARDPRLERDVALKVLPAELAGDAERLARFEREAKALAALSHPHIVTIFSVEEADGVRFLTMELVEGETLDRQIPPGGMALERFLDFAIPLADALAAAHGRGVLHRDLKPANVMVTPEGRVKVLDFGLAKLAGEPVGDLTQIPTGSFEEVTREGRIVGTAPYMSPEQIQGRGADARSDIFSLGVVLYEMATGRRPFAGESAAELVSSILRDEPASTSDLRPELPRQLGRILRHCLAKDPERRFHLAKDLRNELEELRQEVRDETSAARALEAMEGDAQRQAPPSRLKRVAAPALLVVALVVAGLLWLRPGTPPEPAESADVSVPRLVVLPFENLGPPEDEYFADGITDEVTTRLVGLSGLAVIARQTAMLYKASGKSAQEIREELDVDYILEATISWQRGPERSRVRIRPQLIRAAEGTHVWADVYDEDLTEIFAVQTRMATRVVEALDIALAEREQRALAATPTGIPEAHDFYLRGLDYRREFGAYSERDTRIAIELFERAVGLDPGFALAHVALGRAHRDLYWFASDRTPDRLAAAKAAIDRALELDRGLPEARLALALYHYARFEYEPAIRELEVLRARQPHNSEVSLYIGAVRRRQGQMQQAAQAIERAVQLDRRSHSFAYNLGETYWLIREYGLAEREVERSLVLSPDGHAAYWLLARIQLVASGTTAQARATHARAEAAGLGSEPLIAHLAVRLDLLDRRYEDARRRLRAAAPLEAFEDQFEYVPFAELIAETFAGEGRADSARAHYDAARNLVEPKRREFDWDPRYASALAIAYAGLGRREAAIREARRGVELLPVSREAFRGVYAVEALARVYATVGEPDLAVDELERLLSIPSHLSAAYVRLDPRWDPIREHPRFEAMLTRYDLP